MNVLIAYATKNGSTREVAEFIAAVLRDGGEQVALDQARSVRSIAGYDLIVLGAPLYSGRWHADARRFLRRYRRDLAGVPVAVFGLGPRNDTAEAWQRSRAQLGKALAKQPALVPADIVVFGGVDPAGRGARDRKTGRDRGAGRARLARRDLRDWADIRACAARLARLPRRPSAPSPA